MAVSSDDNGGQFTRLERFPWRCGGALLLLVIKNGTAVSSMEMAADSREWSAFLGGAAVPCFLLVFESGRAVASPEMALDAVGFSCSALRR